MPLTQKDDKMKKKDTEPTTEILLPLGMKTKLAKRFEHKRDTIRKYLSGAALTPESQARAKKVREYALNHLQGVYLK